jgi:predicted nucleic-acid-binding protein
MLSKHFKTKTLVYKMIQSEVCIVDEESVNMSLKDMVIIAMSHLPNNQGSIDDILDSMIAHLGKDRVCNQTNKIIMSFNDHKNKVAVKCIKTKI